MLINQHQLSLTNVLLGMGIYTFLITNLLNPEQSTGLLAQASMSVLHTDRI